MCLAGTCPNIAFHVPQSLFAVCPVCAAFHVRLLRIVAARCTVLLRALLLIRRGLRMLETDACQQRRLRGDMRMVRRPGTAVWPSVPPLRCCS